MLPGARVGVAALSGPVDPEKLSRGLEALSALGFVPVPATNLAAETPDRLHAGSDDERLDGFHELAADPDVDAILFARGGHGLLRLLPRLDWGLLASRPRAYVGYSDVTPLLLELTRRLGLVTFHGPMVAADLARGLDPDERASFLDSLAGRLPREVPLAGAAGTAEGPLLGGCLSMLTATLGTPWAPELDGSLLFLEDVGEPLYRLDRMLTHLALSHRLSRIRGLILGQVSAVDRAADRADDPAPPVWVERGLAVAGRTGLPVGWGVPAGHQAPNHTLPLGAAARLEGSTAPGRPGRLVVGIV